MQTALDWGTIQSFSKYILWIFNIDSIISSCFAIWQLILTHLLSYPQSRDDIASSIYKGEKQAAMLFKKTLCISSPPIMKMFDNIHGIDNYMSIKMFWTQSAKTFEY